MLWSDVIFGSNVFSFVLIIFSYTVYTTPKNKTKQRTTQTNKQLLFVQSAPVKEYYGAFRQDLLLVVIGGGRIQRSKIMLTMALKQRWPPFNLWVSDHLWSTSLFQAAQFVEVSKKYHKKKGKCNCSTCDTCSDWVRATPFSNTPVPSWHHPRWRST